MSSSAGSVFVVQDLMNARPGIDLVSFPDWNGLFAVCKDGQDWLHHGLSGAIVMCHVADHPVQGVGINRLLDRIKELEVAVDSLASRVRSEVVEVDGAPVELRQSPRRECVPCGPPVLRESVPDPFRNCVQPGVVTPVDSNAISGVAPVQNQGLPVCAGYSHAQGMVFERQLCGISDLSIARPERKM